MYLKKIKGKIKGLAFKIRGGSVAYWEKRYEEGGNSGGGSYNRLAAFKAEVINEFLSEHTDIENCIEWGCGDGNQLSLIQYKKYTGIDVSQTIVEKNKIKFKEDTSKSFFELSCFLNKESEEFDLSLSLDVIFHLIEDEVYEKYMENLFRYSKKYVCIYSNNEEKVYQGNHVRDRKFTDWIDANKKDWKMVKFVKQRYPMSETNWDWANHSACDFYFYEKV